MSVELLSMIGVVFIALLLVIVFLIPSDKKIKKKQKKTQEESLLKQKDWEQKALRLEKHVQSLRNEILVFQKDEKVRDRELAVEKVKVKKLEEKLSQERQWHEKEQAAVDKKGQEFRELKTELGKVQESFSREHAANIRLERVLKEMKGQMDDLNGQRRSVESEHAQLKARRENDRKEIAQLKKDVAQLSKKNEDVQWVARSEHEKTLQLLKAKEKEIQRLERELEK